MLKSNENELIQNKNRVGKEELKVTLQSQAKVHGHCGECNDKSDILRSSEINPEVSQRQ